MKRDGSTEYCVLAPICSAALAAIQDAMKSMAHVAALQDVLKPSAKMAAIQDALKPLARITSDLDRERIHNDFYCKFRASLRPQ